MKDELKEQIIEILDKWNKPLYEEGILHVCVISVSNFGEVADEILALFKKYKQCENIIKIVKEAWTPEPQIYEKEFIEWIMKGIYVQEETTFWNINMGNKKRFSFNELYSYWKDLKK